MSPDPSPGISPGVESDSGGREKRLPNYRMPLFVGGANIIFQLLFFLSFKDRRDSDSAPRVFAVDYGEELSREDIFPISMTKHHLNLFSNLLISSLLTSVTCMYGQYSHRSLFHGPRMEIVVDARIYVWTIITSTLSIRCLIFLDYDCFVAIKNCI